MKQPSQRSTPQLNRSSAGQSGKYGKQLTPPSHNNVTAPTSQLKPIQAADDKKKKGPASLKEDAQLATDKKKGPASLKEDAQLADKKKKPASMKMDAQLADDKKKKPAAMKMDAQLADDKKKKPAAMKMDAQLADDKKKKPASMKKESGSASPNKMPEHVQQKMESTMNADFSNVNIHVGSKASSVGALAYAQGNDIHFAQGKFNPHTNSGQQLLGHELAHVVQQREGRVKANTSVNGLPVNNDRGLEKEADNLGAKAAASIK